MLNAEIAKMGAKARYTELTLKQKRAISEYVKTGNKAAAIRSAYKTSPKNTSVVANAFFKKPKIISALNKALKDHNFDDAYAVDKLKQIVEGGMGNIEITRPDTALKALETFWKLTNRIGGGDKQPLKLDPEQQAKKMDMSQLQQSLKELDKKQKRILAIITGKVQEGETL